MKLQAYGICGELHAGEPCPLERILALLDMLLGGAPAIVEGHHALVWQAAIGNDEADRRKQFARVELDLRHDPAGVRPAFRPVVEAGVEAHDMVRRSTGATLCQPVDPLVQFGIIPALGFQKIEQRRVGKGRIGPKPAPFDRGPGRGRIARQAPASGYPASHRRCGRCRDAKRTVPDHQTG